MARLARAKSPEEHAELLVNVMDEHKQNRPTPTGLQQYAPRPTDMIITTYAKAGTTLLQNLTYHLAYLTVLAPGSTVSAVETFSDISVACPWLDYMPEFGVAAPEADPRIFKTHSSWDTFAHLHRGEAVAAPRHIVVLRSPLAFAPSFLDFLFDSLTGHVPSSCDRAVREAAFHAFVRRRVAACEGADMEKSWFAHTRGWTVPLRPNVLVLFYEDVVADLKATTRTVAAFMGIEEARVTDEVVEKVAKACERRTMLSDTRFQCDVEAKGLNHDKTWKVMAKDREGSFKQYAYSDEEVEGVKMNMQKVLGYSSYEEFKEATKKFQREKFGR